MPSLVHAVKEEGLVLVADRSTEPAENYDLNDPFPRLPEGVDGVLKANGVLRFNESIDM